jgi:hypothetical protein
LLRLAHLQALLTVAIAKTRTSASTADSGHC